MKGELLQMEKARNLDITEEVYFEIIKQKTASLIACCCGVGATSAKAGLEIVDRMRVFGEKVGMAFQIKDDLFDYGNDEIGKPVGIDIKEKKMTLPLIYALQKASWPERKKIIYTIKNQAHLKKKVRLVIDFVKESEGINYAQQMMQQYYEEAIKVLDNFNEGVYRESLLNLVKFTIERDR